MNNLASIYYDVVPKVSNEGIKYYADRLSKIFNIHESRITSRIIHTSPELEDFAFGGFSGLKYVNMDRENIIIHTVDTSNTGRDMLEVVENVICDYYGITPLIIREKKRKRELNVIPRQMAYYFTRKYANNGRGGKVPLEKIGLYYGGFDHATVIYGIKVIKTLIETSKEVREDFNEIDTKLSRINKFKESSNELQQPN